jgi:hypothetical protein
MHLLDSKLARCYKITALTALCLFVSSCGDGTSNAPVANAFAKKFYSTLDKKHTIRIISATEIEESGPEGNYVGSYTTEGKKIRAVYEVLGSKQSFYFVETDEGIKREGQEAIYYSEAALKAFEETAEKLKLFAKEASLKQADEVRKTRDDQILIRADNGGETSFYGTAYHNDDGSTLETLSFGGWGDFYYPFLKFDLTNGPDATHTGKAVLYLHLDGSLPPNDPQLIICRVLDGWKDSTLSLNRHPNIQQLRSFGPLHPNWNTVDVTDLYKEWQLKPTANHGVCLKSNANNQTNGAFSSSRALNTKLRPFIIVDIIKK